MRIFWQIERESAERETARPLKEPCVEQNVKFARAVHALR
jgi:hypothetical protein